ncbi:MAG: hypothetical protein JNJ47_02690 [Alphaproteobacteria bacterium]|nr:hypothetical protein [Alphaproteobacteria bacterium]
MLWLGKLNQDNKNLNEAFSWYSLSLWTQLIRGASLEDIQKTPINSWKNLSEIIKLPDSSPSQKNYFEFLKTTLPRLTSPLMQVKISKGRAFILSSFLVKSHSLDPLFDAKISAFTFNVIQWINVDSLPT